MYPAALHNIPTHTVVSSHVFARWMRQKQPAMIKSMTKNWDKNTMSDLEQFCPKQFHDRLSTLLSSNTILPKLILSV